MSHNRHRLNIALLAKTRDMSDEKVLDILFLLDLVNNGQPPSTALGGGVTTAVGACYGAAQLLLQNVNTLRRNPERACLSGNGRVGVKKMGNWR